MTNADWINSRPETTTGAMITQAETWYAQTHTQTDAETASLIGKLSAWLTAEHTETERREATVVTALHVTHILRGADADNVIARGTHQRIAEAARAACERGYRGMADTAQPDNVSIGKVQVFGIRREDGGQT